MLIASVFAPTWIVKPMESLLGWFLQTTGNYGVAIVLLTIAIRLIILPLTLYQAKSMKRMQEVQPLFKEIQAKYKDQPEKLQQEMMNIYRTHKVNPLAGCLPMLIQLPFLWAVFALLQTFTVPAGTAPGFLWIPDLSLKDPLFILPTITVVSMYAQMYLSQPATGTDPNQKIMLYAMPVMFGFFSFSMPQSGIVLYWVVSTLVGMVQQAIYPGFPRLQGQVGAKGEA